MAHWNIREALPGDRRRLIAIQRRAGRAELASVSASAFAGPDLRVGLDAVRPVVLVAKVGRTIAGFVAFSPPEILWLYVDPPYMRRGIGRALFRAAMAGCGAEAMLRTFAANAGAMALYRDEGFSVVHRALIAVPGLEHPVESVEMRLAGGRAGAE